MKCALGIKQKEWQVCEPFTWVHQVRMTFNRKICMGGRIEIYLNCWLDNLAQKTKQKKQNNLKS